MPKRPSARALLEEIRACDACKADLPLGPRPVVSFSPSSRILLVGQAPGLRVHESGVPWDDASGERLRAWLGVTSRAFYRPANFAIVPMGFCYPGKGKSGDRPPRPECAPRWMEPVLSRIGKPRLTLLVGQYAQRHFLGERAGATLTETVRGWQAYAPEAFVLPHPSPRNNIWLAKNPWFEKDLLPRLRRAVAGALAR